MSVVTLLCTFGVWCYGGGGCEPAERGSLGATIVYQEGVQFAELDYGSGPWPLMMLEPAPGIGGQTPRVFFGGDGYIQPPTMISLDERSGSAWITMHVRSAFGPGHPALAEGTCTATEGRDG